jgi:hypothetical protein
MAKYIMVVGTSPAAGQEAEFNKWYDEIHIPEVCEIPGITGAKRFASDPSAPGERPYLAIYDLETDDPSAVMAELTRRNVAGEMRMTPAFDLESVQLAIYKVR